MKKLRETKGEEAYKKSSQKGGRIGGAISGGKRSEEARIEKHYRDEKLADAIQAQIDANVEVNEEGDVLPREEAA